ncbi:MAG: lysine--tRNA ligase [Candidatus Micrarchaeota archaeon]|nr:lysine--tRNA ligase [Candidatus Micrarchaeota archaeon]
MVSDEKERLKNKHWTEILADKVQSEKKAPYVITGGMTTSGPAHLGTVCEFLYPAVLKQVLEGRGVAVEMHFVGDILDAFDGIPYEMLKYSKELTPELGKPLCNTVDPLGCHKSFGEHYLDQAVRLMAKLSLKIDVIKANDLYSSGRMDKYALIFLENEGQVKEVIARTSMKKIEELKDWSPIMPICEKCGKIATTMVTQHDKDSYKYVCNRDVEYTKGCGYQGSASIKDHKYKLQWRLHWPAWQALFNSSVEGSGIDHMTKGGSATTAYAIHKEVLKRDPPIFFKYGFVLIHGKKYSKSKGIGMSAMDLSELIPPEILKYCLIEPNLEQNKDIDPTGDKLILIYNDVERISALAKPENRADEKKLLAFNVSIKELPWKASFVDMLLNYQIYKDWDKVASMLGDKSGVAYLSGYIDKWLQKGYEPERYNFSVRQTKITDLNDVVRAFAGSIKPGMSDLQLHNLVYDVAKENGVGSEDLFKAVYTAIIGKDNGPRLGKLLASLGVEKTKEMLDFATT